MSTPSSKRSWLILSDLVGRLEVRCDECKRHGRYRLDRLLSEHGDLPLTEALQAIAKAGGCGRAINPPAANDVNFVISRCKIQRVF